MSSSSSSSASSRVINFGAGPGALPESVLEQMRDEMLNFRGSGMSLVEMSHRSKEFESVLNAAEQDFRRLLKVPDTYRVLFLSGGGTGQFAAVPLNLAGRSNVAPTYIVSGSWSSAALKEAQKYCPTVNKVDIKSFDPAAHSLRGASYVYVCSNETVDGVFFDPADQLAASGDSAESVLVADMSSEILTRSINVSNYGVIFAGAQKNIGIAGVTVVVVRQDLLGKVAKICPVVLDYTTMAEKQSMHNTPPTMAIYAAGLVFQWALQQGGVDALAAAAEQKAKILYGALEEFPQVYVVLVEPALRSRTNIVWRLKDESQEKTFVTEAANLGMVGLSGHRSVGGMRASLYNATSVASVEKLAAFVRDFATKKL